MSHCSGTYTVCVCTIHQNTKLMMIAGKLAEFIAKEEIPLKLYEHYIAFIICNPAQPACYLRTCQYCSGISKLKEQLNTIMDNNLIDKFVSIKSGSLLIGKHWRQLANLQKTL